MSAPRDPGFESQIEERLLEALILPDPTADGGAAVLLEAARHLILAPGAKRARPRLVRLFGRAVEAPTAALMDLSVAAELIHSASLLHDDVVDSGTERRGQPAANIVWGNIAAVLSGDLLLSRAIQQLGAHPQPVTATAVSCVADMSKAALLEVRARGRIDISIQHWKNIAMGKTGALFGWCGRGAALLVEDEDAAQRFDQCGQHFGVAFQMADDLKDLTAVGANKTRYADIRNHNPSYPLLWAAHQSTAIQQHIEQAWSNGAVKESKAAAIGAAVLESGAIEQTWTQIRHHLEKAFTALGPYANRPGTTELAQWAAGLWKRFSNEPAPNALQKGP